MSINIKLFEKINTYFLALSLISLFSLTSCSGIVLEYQLSELWKDTNRPNSISFSEDLVLAIKEGKASIILINPEPEIPPGVSTYLSAKIKKIDGLEYTIPNDFSLNWQAAQNTDLIIDSTTGKVQVSKTATAADTITINLNVTHTRLNTPLTAQTQIKVSQAALTNIHISLLGNSQNSAQTMIINQGVEQKLIAVGLYSDGKTRDITNQVQWNSNSPLNAPVSTEGTLTAKLPTTDEIVITASEAEISGFANISINPIQSLVIQSPNSSLPKGTSSTFTANLKYKDGNQTSIPNTFDILWSSDKTSEISINPTTGLAQAQTNAQGNQSVSLSLSVTQKGTNNPIEAETQVTVSNAVLVSISVPLNPITIKQGGQSNVIATGTYSDGSSMNITPMLTWKSYDNSEVFINNAGKLVATSQAQGNAKIIGTYPNSTLQPVSATVNVLPITAVKIINNNPTVSQWGTSSTSLIAHAIYSDTSEDILPSFVTASWSSDKPLHITIGQTTGVATSTITSAWQQTANITLSASLPGVGTPLTAQTQLTVTIGQISCNILPNQNLNPNNLYCNDPTTSIGNGIRTGAINPGYSQLCGAILADANIYCNDNVSTAFGTASRTTWYLVGQTNGNLTFTPKCGACLWNISAPLQSGYWCSPSAVNGGKVGQGPGWIYKGFILSSDCFNSNNVNLTCSISPDSTNQSNILTCNNDATVLENGFSTCTINAGTPQICCVSNRNNSVMCNDNVISRPISNWYSIGTTNGNIEFTAGCGICLWNKDNNTYQCLKSSTNGAHIDSLGQWENKGSILPTSCFQN